MVSVDGLLDRIEARKMVIDRDGMIATLFENAYWDCRENNFPVTGFNIQMIIKRSLMGVLRGADILYNECGYSIPFEVNAK